MLFDTAGTLLLLPPPRKARPSLDDVVEPLMKAHYNGLCMMRLPSLSPRASAYRAPDAPLYFSRYQQQIHGTSNISFDKLKT